MGWDAVFLLVVTNVSEHIFSILRAEVFSEMLLTTPTLFTRHQYPEDHNPQ
jgi:hypothetical protein